MSDEVRPINDDPYSGLLDDHVDINCHVINMANLECGDSIATMEKKLKKVVCKVLADRKYLYKLAKGEQ